MPNVTNLGTNHLQHYYEEIMKNTSRLEYKTYVGCLNIKEKQSSIQNAVNHRSCLCITEKSVSVDRQDHFNDQKRLYDLAKSMGHTHKIWIARSDSLTRSSH